MEAMKELMSAYQEIASYLGDENSLYMLEDLAARQKSGEFYLPVIGQYSAGKSKLINTLLGMNHLPTRGTETTAFPTFIAYGEEEYAFVEYRDGSILPISPEDLEAYRHTGNAIGDIKALHLKIRHSLLEQGLVIVDTPGFNTLVRSHEEVTLSVIPQAQFLIYVMGKPLTDYDTQLLRNIGSMGIELIFVRTKLDEVKRSEESLEEVLQVESARMQSFLERKRPFFAITSDSELLKQAEWKRRIEAVQEYISGQMNPHLQDLWKQSLNGRLLRLGRDFMNNLRERELLLKSAGQVDAGRLQEQLVYLEQQMAVMNTSYSASSLQIQSELAAYQWKIRSSANELKDACALKFQQEIERQSDINNMQKQALTIANRQIELHMQQIQLMLTGYLEQMTEQGFKGAQHRIEALSQQLENNLKLEIPFELSLPDAERLYQTRHYVMDQLQEELEALAELLQRSDAELSEYNLSKENIQEMLQEMVLRTSEARNEVEGIGAYAPQMKWVEGDERASEFMGQMGNLADWLTMFIPAKGAVTVAAKAEKIGKVTQLVQKFNGSAKVLQAATKTAEAASKGTELLKSLDKAVDMIGKARGVQEIIRQKIPKEQSGLLDAITLEYWFSKAGSLFDTPAHYELDKVAEAAYLNRKRELEHRQQQAVQKELNQLEELQLIRRKEERVQKEKELLLKNHKSLERQLEMERDKANREAASLYARQLGGLFEEELSKVHDLLLNQLDQAYHQQVQAIVISATFESRQRVESVQSHLQQLLDEKQRYAMGQEQSVVQVQKYLEWLEATAAEMGDPV